MGKALKTVGVIIGAAALIATGVGALAMPALAGTTTLFGVSVGTLNTISSGLVAVGGMLDKPKSQGSASPDEWTSNPDQPIPFLMGRMGVAGKIVQRDEFGPDNMYQGIVGIISGAGPIRGVTAFAGDKQPVTFGANGIATSSQWQGEMWMVRRAGNQPDTVLTVPAGLKTGGTAFEWTAAAKLSGNACYLQVLGENSKGTAYPAGIPDPVHTAEGIYGYDPRYDDTYPGGAGPCRLGVRSTYRWIEDGGVGALNWALGLVENGQVVGGIGASVDGIDVPAFVEVANIADANGWKLAAWPDTSEDASAVLDQLLQAAGAVRARHAGKISCVSRGAPRASVATITARDTAGDIELDTAPSLFNRLNTITPRFMSEAAGWVLTPANPVSFAQYVTDDGGKHGDQIDYRFVPLLKQAAELAAYDILDAREPFSGTIPLKAHMRHLKRGDTFLVSEPGFLMDGVKCIVLSRSYDPKTAQVRIGFRSETDSKHALALGKTTTLPAFPVLTPTDPTLVNPPLPGDWTVVVTPPATDGTLVPGIDLTGVVTNATADAMLISWRVVAEGEDPAVAPVFLNEDKEIVPGWVDAGIWPPTTQNLTIQGPQSGTVVWIAIRYRRGNNVSLPDLRGPLTVGVLTAGDVAPGSNFFDTVRDLVDAAVGDYEPPEIDELRADLEAQIAAARDEAEAGIATEGAARIAALSAETTARIAAIAAEALARGSAINGVTSSVTTVATDLATETSTRNSQVASLSGSLTFINSYIDTVASALAAETTNRTDQYSALNGSIAAVSTSVSTVATNLAAETATRTTQYSSLGTSIAAVDTRVTTVATDLAAETSTRSSQTSSLAGSISFINSYVDTVASALAAETTARTTQGSTLNDAIATVTSSVSTVASNLAAETTTRTTQYSSLGTSIATVDGRVTTVATDLSAEVTTRSAQTASLSGSISFINSYVDTVASALSAETTARTSQGSTLAGSIAGVSTSVSTVASNLAAETSTRSSQYSSLSGSVATVDGRVTTVANDLAAETTARNTQASSIGGSISFLSSYIETVATAQSATAVTVSNLSTTVGSNTASIASVSSVAVDAQGKANAIQGLVLDVNGYVSGSRSTNNGTRSTFDVLTDVFSLRAPGSGLRTEFRSGIWYTYDPDAGTRTMYGKPFGGSNKLTWWTGPSSVSEGSETKANAYVYISMVAPRFGGSDVPAGPGLQVTQSATARVGLSATTGAVTTPTVTLSFTGAQGSVTVSWSNSFGDDSLSATAPSGTTTAFTGTVSTAQRKQALFSWVATDGVSTRTGTVAATILHNI